MNNDVFISVKGSFAVIGEGNPDTPEIEVINRGSYYERNGSKYILYEEVSEGFTQPIKNLIKISEGKVSLKKSGLIQTEMQFEEGKTGLSHYVTPYGNLVMGLLTKQLCMDIDEHEIRIRAVYELELNYAKASDCEVNIHITDDPAVIGFSVNA